MKLISCDGCGLVYDQDKIAWPEIHEWDDDSNCERIEGNSEWSNDENDFVPIFHCTCGEDVRKEK